MNINYTILGKRMEAIFAILCMVMLSLVGIDAQSLAANRAEYFFQNNMEDAKTDISAKQLPDQMTIDQALEYLQKRFEVNFSYLADLKSIGDVPSSLMQSSNIEEILLRIFRGTPFGFKEVESRFYVIFDRLSPRKEKEPVVPAPEIVRDVRKVASISQVDRLPAGRQLLLTLIRDKDINISGQVMDEEGNPLIGVNVRVKGTDIGAATDLDGKFEILNIDENVTLVFSYVGYQTTEVPVGGRETLTVTMLSDAALLDEVVVVGYGAKKRKDIISGVSSLNTEQMGLEDQLTPTAGSLLKGRISGINIRESTGAAGATPNIQIRGISSINAGVGPLIVIDGFPVGTSFPQTLNPDEISDISVLKDAAATAIYGARGSNGVVLIETKRAREGVSEFTYNTYVAANEVPHSWRPQMMNALEYAQFNIERIQALDLYNNAQNPTSIPSVFTEVVNNPEKWADGGTDWLDEFLREGTESLTHNHSLTYRSGNERLRTVVSAGYMDQAGIIPGNDFQRLSLRTKLDATISPRIKMGVNLSGSRIINNRVDTDGTRSALWAAVVGSPLQSPYDENGYPTYHMAADAPGYFAMPNPLHSMNVIENRAVDKDLQVNLNFDVEIIKGLNYRPRVYGRQLSRSFDYFKPTTVGNVLTAGAGNLLAGGPPQPNSRIFESFELENWGVDNILNYQTGFRNHNLNILLGQTVQKEEAATNVLNGAVFPSDNIVNFSEAGEIQASNDYYDWSLVAGFARLNYDFRSKYLVELNFRREGSSRLGSNNRFGNFPSGAIGWRVSGESFYPSGFLINDLLLNASLGRTGNNAIGNYDALGRLAPIRNVMGNNVVEGKFQTSIRNDDLMWETASQYQMGIQLGMFQDRIMVKVNYFKKTTEDMLFNVVLPGASGFSATRINLGEMENKGTEVEMVSSNILKKDFQWNTEFNISFLSNRVTRMPEQIQEIISGYLRGTNVTRVGEEVGAFYGFVRLGLFDETTIVDPSLYGWQGNEKILGTNIFQDINGDGIIDYNDQTVIGSPHPNVIFGLNNRITYKNFSMSFLLTGMLGYQIMAANNGVFYNNAARWNVSKDLLERWRSTEEPGAGKVPRLEYTPGNRESMDDWLEPGDHLWIRNVNFSYAFPDSWTGKIRNLRIYLSVNNLARFDNYSGFNPEVSQSGNNPLSIGVDNFVYPISRSYSVGVDFRF